MILEPIKRRVGGDFRRNAVDGSGFDDRGFALLEVLIAIGVLLVAAFGLTVLSAGTWKNTDSSKSYTEGSVLAARNLEALFSEKYSSDQASGMSTAITVGDHLLISSDGRYTITYRIKDNDILPDTKTVQMQVTFARGSSTKTIRYNYLLPVRK